MNAAPYGAEVGWQPASPSLRPLRLALSWAVSAVAVAVASAIVPGVDLKAPGDALLLAAAIALLNAFLPPLIAALRLPFTLLLGFFLVLFADAGALLLADDLLSDFIEVGGFADALLASLVIAAASIAIMSCVPLRLAS